MKHSILLLLVALSILLSCSGNGLEEHEVLYKSGEREFVYYKDANNLKQGKLIHYSKSGKILDVNYYKDNKLHGWNYKYYPNGRIEQKFKYRRGQLVDTTYNYYESGKLESIQIYKTGEEENLKSTIFHENGNISLIRAYELKTQIVSAYVKYTQSGEMLEDWKDTKFVRMKRVNDNLRFTLLGLPKNYDSVKVYFFYESFEDFEKNFETYLKHPLQKKYKKNEIIDYPLNYIKDKNAPINVLICGYAKYEHFVMSLLYKVHLENLNDIPKNNLYPIL